MVVTVHIGSPVFFNGVNGNILKRLPVSLYCLLLSIITLTANSYTYTQSYGVKSLFTFITDSPKTSDKVLYIHE